MVRLSPRHRHLSATALAIILITGCTSTSTADDVPAVEAEAAESSSTEVIITGTGGGTDRANAAETDGAQTDGAQTGGAEAGGVDTDGDSAATDGSGDGDEAQGNDDQGNNSPGNSDQGNDSQGNSDQGNDEAGETNETDETGENQDDGAAGDDATGDQSDDSGSTDLGTGATCSGSEPVWPVQTELVVDLDADGRDETVRTYSSPREETVLGIAWGGGGWTGVDVGALPDDGDVVIAGAPDLDGDGRREIVTASPGPLPDRLVQIADVDGCDIDFVIDSRTGGIFESVTFARFDAFAGVTCLPLGVTVIFGSLDGDDGAYRVSRSDAALIGDTLVFDEALVAVEPVDDVGDVAPIVGCGRG